MTNITNKTWVIITRGSGRHFVSENGKLSIVNVLNAPDAPRMLQVNDVYIAANDIVGIVTAAQLEEIDRQRQGDWKCHRNNWHKKNEVCKCGWGEYKPTELEEEDNRSDVEKERATLIGDLVENGMRIRDLPTLNGLTNEELAAKLEKYKKYKISK